MTACFQALASSASMAALLVFQPVMAGESAGAAVESATATPKVVKGWKAPALSALGKDAYGDMVRYGYALTAETYAHIGPNAKNQKMRYAGNNLSCQSCHEERATKPYAMPWVGVSAKYPIYRSRDNVIGTVEDRVNECMERSMAGKPLPFDGREMKAFVSYIQFLSTDIPIGSHVEGAGVTKFDPPARKADLVAGKALFEQHCASCHQPTGAGLPAGQLTKGQRVYISAGMGQG